MSYEAMSALVRAADVLLVSGGNTLFAVDRWVKCRLHPLLHEAAARGAVLTGGSAGAICWFDGGHSDSADADSFRITMLEEAAATTAAAAAADGAGGCAGAAIDESSAAPEAGQQAKAWTYIRAPCLALLPGLVCPHFDRTQVLSFTILKTLHPLHPLRPLRPLRRELTPYQP